jgi:hypothetical protein
MQADELRLPTEAVSVHLAVGPHDTWYERGDLFVVEDHKRGEAVDALSALLEGATQFVPFRTEKLVRLVAKSAIVYVAIPGETEPPSAEAELVLYDRQHRVEVLLVQGTRFEGLLFDSSPGSHPRAIDHLNSATHFLRLWTAKECVLIAKSQIATVTELVEPT